MVIISFMAALFSLFLAVFIFFRDRHSFINLVFAIGMIPLVLEANFSGLSFQAGSAQEIIRYQRLGLAVAAFLPGCWLLFSVSFGQTNYWEILRKWRWGLLVFFIFPVVLISVFWKYFLFTEISFSELALSSFLLEWAGYAIHIFLLLGSVLVLVNLERTFRASAGAARWQIKFMILGLGTLFAARIYTSSQALLFSYMDPEVNFFNASALLAACVLITVSLIRGGQLNINLYFSHSFIYNSIIVLIIGIYLISAGILAKLAPYFGGTQYLPLQALIVFLTLLAMVVFLLSEKVRQRIREFISRHLKRPHYDYRREWEEFTKRTTSLIDIKKLSSAVTKMVAETFGVSSVSIWLLDDTKGYLKLEGSTVFSDELAKSINLPEKNSSEFMVAFCQQKKPVDLDLIKDNWALELKKQNPERFMKSRIRYWIPLTINDQFLGVLTLNNRITGRPFSGEDFDLLKTIADQTAGSFLNLKLSEHLREMREIEAFRNISSFMVHDLKNVASTLSLTMQNMPFYLDNQEFRQDAIRNVEKSVMKIKNLCASLSSLSQKIELKRESIDLNEVVNTTAIILNGALKAKLNQNLQPLPKLFVDPEQIQKVLTNLILNADEAVKRRGEIQVSTAQKDSWVVLSVSDNGCGMSREFMERSLFRPFKTTKKQGMGIGLYQSKMIVEAHGGRIEVESEENVGTTFRVLLPVGERG